MQKQEILNTKYAEMLDMISCLAIYNGAEPQRKKKIITDFDAAMALRWVDGNIRKGPIKRR